MKPLQPFFALLAGRVTSFSVGQRSDLACSDMSLNASTNIWHSYQLHPNPVYREHVLGAAEAIRDPVLKKKALRVADVGTFIWLNNPSALLTAQAAASQAPHNNIVGVILQGLRTGECTSPRFRPVDPESYQRDYIERKSLQVYQLIRTPLT